LSKIIENVFHEDSQSTQANRYAASITPAKFIKFPNFEIDWQKWKEITDIGEQVIKDGKTVAFTMAAGEETRLGCVIPKETLQAILLKKSFFQVFVEKIRAAERKCEILMHWIIMTSKQIYNEISDFFEK
jgi:UDP-N-acetylglucosamine pyrophosphorylase